MSEPSPKSKESRPGLWFAFKTLQARLRFVFVIVAVGGLIAYWDTLTAYYEKWTRPKAEATAASLDVEYFCPMHPYIVRDTSKDKCPICHMDLARRKKGAGTADPLPAGAVSRVQLTPYRVVLAGVQTSEVQFQPLVKEIATYGTVEFDETKQALIAARQKGRIEKLIVNYTGQLVEPGEKLALLDVRYSPELTVTLEDYLRARQSGSKDKEASARKRLQLWDIGEDQIQEFISTGRVSTKLTITSPIKGHVIKKYQREGNFVEEGTPLYDVANLDTVWIEAQVYEADQALLKVGQTVTATTVSLPNEKFEGRLSFIYPHLDETTRTLTVRLEMPNQGHRLRPGMYANVSFQVLPSQFDSLAKSAANSEKARSELQNERVLAVPDSAVIDTGSLKIVYREADPNVFEGIVVQLGPRMSAPGSTAAQYPVIDGLKAGDRIVTHGSFLIDAETRLNPSAGSIYFGGSGTKSGSSSVSVRPSTPESDDDKERKLTAELAKLNPDDRRTATEQRFCAVLSTNRLGSMGPPIKVMVENQPVFLCCEGCEDMAKADPAKTIAKVKELKEKSKAAKPKP